MANELRNNDLGVFEPTDDFFGDFGKNFFNSIASNQMKTDVTENKNDYVVTSELPGFKKDNIHIDYENDNLNIRATHDLKKEDNNKEGRVIRKERTVRDSSRSFYLPNVENDKISASYDGGILKITLPKTEKGNDKHKINID